MAAKEIQTSIDAGVTWRTMPGSTGVFNEESTPIDDTIFGNIYQSQEAGLVSWTMTGEAIWKGFAGYKAALKEVGTGTATTGEAMSLESGQIYAIDDTTKQIWDRNSAITVYDGTTDVTNEVEWYDYLFGRVKFLDTYTVVGSITIDVTYFPTATLGRGNSYTLTMTSNMIDNSDFPSTQANGGYRTFEAGLRTVELELGGIFDAAVDAHAKLKARGTIIIEVDPAGDGESIARGFFRMITANQSGDVGALEESTLNFTLNVPDDDQMYIPFGWQHGAGTLLSQSIRDILDKWLHPSDNTFLARYLPEGTIGNSPLDGVEGDVLLSDISLSGGLEDMNVFTAEMQGSGEHTEV